MRFHAFSGVLFLFSDIFLVFNPLILLVCHAVLLIPTESIGVANTTLAKLESTFLYGDIMVVFDACVCFTAFSHQY